MKSRLSSLIAAVSGKISSSGGSGKSSGEPTAAAGGKGRTNNTAEETANSSKSSKTPPSGQLEKWHSALRIGNKAAATTTPLTDNGDQLISSREGEEAEDEDNGRLVAGRLLLGTKILVERESGRLFPAVISGHDGNNRVAVTWKEQQQLSQQLTSIVNSSSGGPSVSYYEADDLVVKGVLDLPALSSDRLRSGSRVAVFPHPETAYLLPGTVRHFPRTSQLICSLGLKQFCGSGAFLTLGSGIRDKHPGSATLGKNDPEK